MTRWAPAWLAFVFSTQLVAAPGEWDAESAWYSCSSCHGVEGHGSEPKQAPAIAGQSRDYLARQLRQFRDGKRGAPLEDKYGQQMALMTVNLDDGEIEMLADYAASLSPRPGASVGAASGKKLYSKCATCHGPAAQGNPGLSAPSLRGLTVDYIERQQRNFLSGIRGYAPDDIPGKQMAAAARLVGSEEELRLLAEYISGL
jgi:cytochrome c553